MKFNSLYKGILSLTLALALALPMSLLVYAETMSSPTYTLDGGLFNMGGLIPTSIPGEEEVKDPTQVPPSISEVKVTDITLTSAIISWKTSTVATTDIMYGETTAYGRTDKDESTGSVTNHLVRLGGLKSGTTYNFRLFGTEVSTGKIVASDNYTFSTITFPVISGVSVATVDANTVNVAWLTNVATDSLVEYGPSQNNLKDSAGSSDLVTSHVVKLSGLKGSHKYYFRVSGRDQYGNQVISAVSSFETPADDRPPLISEVKSETAVVGSGDTSRIQLIISWTTDEAATSRVEYGAGIGVGTELQYPESTKEDDSLNISHIVIISGLEPSTTYHFRVVSKDANGNLAQSDDFTILTPPREESIIQLVVKSWEETFSWVKNLRVILKLGEEEL